MARVLTSVACSDPSSGQAVRKAKRNVAGFDAALERTRLTGQTAAQREELADELATLAAKLQDNRTTLLSLLATAGEGTADGRELVASKTSLDEVRLCASSLLLTGPAGSPARASSSGDDRSLPPPVPCSQRIVQHATFAEAHAKRAKPVTSSLDPEEQSIVDTLAWLIGATSKLRAQLSRSESTIESALSSVSQAKSVAEEAKRMEIFNELLGRNEDRQWHVERLEQVESRFTANELSVEQILGVKDAVDKFIKYNEVRVASILAFWLTSSRPPLCSSPLAVCRLQDGPFHLFFLGPRPQSVPRCSQA
jgi:ABC-type transporter Mla subunit MlaD